MNKTIFRKAICYIAIVISFISLLPVEALAASYEYYFEDYQDIINQVNAEFDMNLAITNEDVFMENVFNEMSPEEFRNMLTGNMAQENSAVPDDETIEIPIIAPLVAPEIIKYSVDISYGTWSSRLNANIETIIGVSGTNSFLRYVNAGYAWDANWSTWLFYGNAINCISFSSSSCKVSYKGYWTIPKTGVTDLTLLTYTITYYP